VLGRLLARLAEREGVMTLAELDAWLAARDAELPPRAPRGHADATTGTGDASAGPASPPEGWLAWLVRLLRRRA
jgi:hypothetical protein